MKVILLRDIYKHGVAGEIVEVKDGFARNYLIPRGMAKLATSSAIKNHEKLMEQVEARRASYNKMLNELARQIDGVELIFERRASVTGTLYGSVTTQEVADALMEATGVDINRRRISQQAVRELGEFQVPVRLGNEISPILNVIVIREGEMEEFLAAREAGEEFESDVEDITEDATEIMPESVVQEAIAMADAEAAAEATDESAE